MARKKDSSNSRLLHVDQQLAGETVAAAVRSMLPEISWSQARRMITTRQVQIDGNLCLDSGRRIKAGEVIKLFHEPLPRLPDVTDIELVHLDDSIAIVNKPSGMVSVRHAEEQNWNVRRKQYQPTLDELMPQVLLNASKIDRGRAPKIFKGKPNDRFDPDRLPGRLHRVFPVHRLDRETSGLMVFGRSEQAEAALIAQFSSHSIERVYWAIVRGKVQDQKIETILVRDRGDGIRGSVGKDDPLARKGQRAVTHVRTIRDLRSFSLVECRLETGRTHQIRIHLAEMGAPLCGERSYLGPIGLPARRDESGAQRVALHAVRLGLVHPESERSLVFDSPFPADLQKLADRLEGKAPPEQPAPKGSRGRKR